jgi:acetyl esterase/lipase
MKAYAAEPPILERDITFATADGIDLKLDLCRPSTGTGPFPALLYIHGGAWTFSGMGFHTKTECASMLSKAASKGYVAVSVDHRDLAFDRQARAMTNQFPAQVYDVKCAVRWLRANAKRYSIDSDRIGAVGWDSGGYLALMLALTDKIDGLEGDLGDMTYSSRVQAAVSSAGATEFVSLSSQAPAVTSGYLGGPPEKLPDVYVKASPLTYVTRDDPPVLLIWGDLDKVDLKQAELLDAKLTEVGVPHTLVTKAGYGHDVALWDEKEVWKFLGDNLHP